MKKIIHIIAVCLSLMTVHASAVEKKLEIILSVRPVLNSYLVDGTIVGTGKVIYHGEHTGFQVWLDGERHNNIPTRYLITGKNNGSNKLFVRLEQTGWEPNEKANGGLITYSREEQADFSIVADGGQQISADEYVIVAKAKVSQADDS
ncbi:AfaD family invasin [Enterobacter bugandensis]|uniref:AfaD family invasin n=1 Tax=Enterobacter bugandensis TaxID=881260 RepID=UPI00235F83F9|nr:AfaD family invasin [Enterobacter bugandensis]